MTLVRVMVAAMNQPKFEIVTTTAGAVSIKNNVVNEIMHNPVGPWVEANRLYIEQSRLRDRLLEDTKDELVIFDVGLGAAANSLAAIACCQALGTRSRPLQIVSFEKDLELLEFALANSERFEHFKGFEPAIKSLLSSGRWNEGQIKWELRKGEFSTLIESESTNAHMIFFDPYSPKVNQEMWTKSLFRKLRLRSREAADGGTVLLTYSQATRIRAALICAGFRVGYGLSTGLKEETTQAATTDTLLASPLDKAWFDRWQRSHSRYPFEAKPEDYAEIDEAIETYKRSLAF